METKKKEAIEKMQCEAALRVYSDVDMNAPISKVSLHDSDGPAKWLVAFAQKDLSGLSKAQRLDVLFEAQVLLSHSDIFFKSEFDIDNWDGTDEGYRKQTLPTWDHLVKFQRTVKEILDGVIERKPIRLEFNRLAIDFSPNREGVEYRHTDGSITLLEGWDRRYILTSIESRLGFALANILYDKIVGSLLRCPVCNGYFLKGKKMSKRFRPHCSQDCYAVTFQRAKRGTPPERYGRKGRPIRTGKRGRKSTKGGSGHGAKRR